MKKSPTFLKKALMSLVAEFGDVTVENGIVTVTCPDGSVWDFTEPMMVKVGKIPKLNKWKDAQLSVRADSKSAATLKAELAEKVKDLAQRDAVIDAQHNAIEDYRNKLNDALKDVHKLSTGAADQDLTFLRTVLPKGQLELRVRYSNGWKAEVVLLNKREEDYYPESMLQYYLGPMAALIPPPVAVTLMKACGQTSGIAVDMVAKAAWNFKLGTPPAQKEQP